MPDLNFSPKLGRDATKFHLIVESSEFEYRSSLRAMSVMKLHKKAQMARDREEGPVVLVSPKNFVCAK